MACMCGDTECPSCGPLQGADPAFSRVCEWFENVVLVDMSPGLDVPWLAEDLASRFGKLNSAIVDAIYMEATRWASAQRAIARAEQAARLERK